MDPAGGRGDRPPPTRATPPSSAPPPAPVAPQRQPRRGSGDRPPVAPPLGPAPPTSSIRRPPDPPQNVPSERGSPPLCSRNRDGARLLRAPFPFARRRRSRMPRAQRSVRYHPRPMAPEAARDRERPVIGFLTDFGLDGAAAICRGVMLSIARDAQIVDISHTVTKYAIARRRLPAGERGPVAARRRPRRGGRSRRRHGPPADRVCDGARRRPRRPGQRAAAARRASGSAASTEARTIENRDWLLPATSSTFHGRDIFAPVAAHLAIGAPFADVGPTVDPGDARRARPVAAATVTDGRLATEVAYVDSFGNLRLAGGVAELAAALGPVEPGAPLELSLSGGTTADGRATRALVAHLRRDAGRRAARLRGLGRGPRDRGVQRECRAPARPRHGRANRHPPRLTLHSAAQEEDTPWRACGSSRSESSRCCSPPAAPAARPPPPAARPRSPPTQAQPAPVGDRRADAGRVRHGEPRHEDRRHAHGRHGQPGLPAVLPRLATGATPSPGTRPGATRRPARASRARPPTRSPSSSASPRTRSPGSRSPFNKSFAPGPKDFDIFINQVSFNERARRERRPVRGLLLRQPDRGRHGGQRVRRRDDPHGAEGRELGAQVGTTSLATIEDVIQPTAERSSTTPPTTRSRT